MLPSVEGQDNVGTCVDEIAMEGTFTYLNRLRGDLRQKRCV